ncbi:hypothetical protein FK531_09050 [Rhodococcus spelaei]|uniref:Uncharacterized protein n=1 Tax=Rhodococcus spelaei TaxID=2546320 RepID=A0A541BN30_9NOCA|nr:hypothetical protein [Rhodococcus spelaei]TQF73732.1 hypothetical protein FK531_09050 [Rhodococcus spelaei]
MVAAGLAALTLVSACGSGDDSAPTTTTTAASNETTVPVSAVTTQVLDPGVEPREKVTFHPATNVPQHVLLTTTSKVYQQIDDQAQQDFSTPDLGMPLTATVNGGQHDPASAVDLTLGTLTTPDARLQDALKVSDGSKAGLTITPSGSVTALRITPAPDSKDIARSAIEQAFYQAVYRTVAFPDAEIGVGAVWTVAQQVTSGIALNQVTTATLKARDGDRLTVEVSVNQTPASKVWDLPGEAGTLNIDTYVMAGTGTLVLDLSSPLPVDGTVNVGGEQTYSDPNSTTRLRQATSSQVKWASR